MSPKKSDDNSIRYAIVASKQTMLALLCCRLKVKFRCDQGNDAANRDSRVCLSDLHAIWLRGIQKPTDDASSHARAHLLRRLLLRVRAQLMLS